jgi:hypothetical protein
VSRESRARFAEVVRAEEVDLGLACLLLAAEADQGLDPAPSLAELDRLAAAVDPRKSPADALRAVLAGFTGDAHDYGDLRSSLLHEVLRRRAGLPILLTVVWLEVARRAGVPAAGIGLPGHFVARIGDDYVDPFAGGAPLDVSALSAEDLRPWQPTETLLRILTNIRVWARQSPDRSATLLWAVELSLLLPRHPVALRLEHGSLLVAGGDFLGGAAQLDAYAEAVAPVDAGAAEKAQHEARAARARLN